MIRVRASLHETIHSQEAKRDLRKIFNQINSRPLLLHNLGNYSLWCLAEGLCACLDHLLFGLLTPVWLPLLDSALQCQHLGAWSIVAPHLVLERDNLQEVREEVQKLSMKSLIRVGLPEGHSSICVLGLALCRCTTRWCLDEPLHETIYLLFITLLDARGFSSRGSSGPNPSCLC